MSSVPIEGVRPVSVLMLPVPRVGCPRPTHDLEAGDARPRRPSGPPSGHTEPVELKVPGWHCPALAVGGVLAAAGITQADRAAGAMLAVVAIGCVGLAWLQRPGWLLRATPGCLQVRRAARGVLTLRWDELSSAVPVLSRRGTRAVAVELDDGRGGLPVPVAGWRLGIDCTELAARLESART